MQWVLIGVLCGFLAFLPRAAEACSHEGKHALGVAMVTILLLFCTTFGLPFLFLIRGWRHRWRQRKAPTTGDWLPLCASSAPLARHIPRIAVLLVLMGLVAFALPVLGVFFGVAISAFAQLDGAWTIAGLGVGGAAGSVLAYRLMNHPFAWGNARLRRETMAALPAMDAAIVQSGTFVGVQRTENYFRPMAIETDGNVGFVGFDADELVLAFPEITRRLQRDQVVNLFRVPIAQVPRLAWLRIDFMDDRNVLRGVLMQSRDFSGTRGITDATDTLHNAIVDWMADTALRDMGLRQ